MWSRCQRFVPLAFSLLLTLAAAPVAYLVSLQAGELGQYGLLAYPVIAVAQALTSATLFLPGARRGSRGGGRHVPRSVLGRGLRRRRKRDG